MLDDFPEVQERNRGSGKLILPPHTGQLPSPNAHEQKTTAYSDSGPLPFSNLHKQQHAAYPGQLLPPNLSKAATNHLGKFWQLVRKDPAYRLLLVAVVMVLISSIVFVSFASSLFFAPAQNPSPPSLSVTVTGTVDLHPTFAPPHGGQGSTTSSQPPKHATPSLVNDPGMTAQATPPTGGTLAVEIAGIPLQVPNNTTVPVTILANQPGVSVRLFVQYNVAPGFFSSGAQTTDGGGTATLSWRVRVIGTRTAAIARVTAIAQGRNGQQATSQTVTVQIISGGISF